VRFAVLQITLLATAGLIGTLVRQFPSFALHDPTAYAQQVATMHQHWDPIGFGGVSIGPALVEVFDRLGFFRVFTAPWFVLLLSLLTVSIICCTLDRTPRLWRGVRHVTVDQPEPFFDTRLPERALVGSATVTPVEMEKWLRRKRFKVRTASAVDGAQYVYGDRNQYFKLATLLTHTGLVLFLAGGAVTAGLGFETVLFVADGQTAPVQPVGTAHNLLVKNVDFQAPQRADGTFVDFWTDLAIYQDGQQIARKQIRVNDPLVLDGYVFHQNTFGPTADVTIRDGAGSLVWDGPIVLTPDENTGTPSAFQAIPGSDMGIEWLLSRTNDGSAVLGVVGIGPTDSSGQAPVLFLSRLARGASSDPAATGGYTVTWNGTSAWTGIVIKKDPGETVIWLAFLFLISGLVLSFYFPRRRVWARFSENHLQLTMLADRYVDIRREFAAVVEAAGGEPAKAE
jgi:cytochrome c biogenesis protein